MDLGLAVTRTTGRPEAKVSAMIVRPLVPSDLEALALLKGSKTPPLKKLRDSHHSLARLIAQGLPGATIAAITGYTESRISTLKSDPAFQDLVAFYRKNVESAFADLQERMSDLSLDVVQELRERFEDDPESFSTDQIMDMLKTFADRTGHGPQAKNLNINVNANLGDRLKSARERVSLKTIEAKVIDGQG